MKHRAVMQLTYEALTKWLGLPKGVSVISVSNEQGKEVCNFHLMDNDGNHCPDTIEGHHSMVRYIGSKEMIAPTLEKELVFKIGKYRLYKVNDEPTD